MPNFFRRRRTLRWPITLSVLLMALNVTLMVCWIVLLVQLSSWSALTVGIIFFSLILVGLIVYLVLTIKEVRLNQRQANFVDSVTHELKSPIASLRLYLETLQMRQIPQHQAADFYQVMEHELQRLDRLISQLLEVGRLDAIEQDAEPEDVPVGSLLARCAAAACAHQNCNMNDVFQFKIQPTVIRGRKLVLEMIFGNLFDNAIKYSGDEPAVDVEVRVLPRGQRVLVRITDNGPGVPVEIRKKIFRMFYRGGSELERKQKGTGLGLYIVHSLVHNMKGSVNVYNRSGSTGSVFEVELAGRAMEATAKTDYGDDIANHEILMPTVGLKERN